MATSKKKISTIAYAPMVEQVNRKFALRKETCTTKEIGNKIIPGVTYMGGSTRHVNINGYGPVNKQIMFFRKPFKRGPLSSSERIARANFTEVVAWTKALMGDLSTLSQNQIKYKTCVDDPSKSVAGVYAAGYEGMRGWVFAIGIQILGEGQPLPSDHVLPAVA